MAHHNSTPPSVLNAPERTVTPACPVSKCRKTEGHDGGIHPMQRRRGMTPRRYPVSRYRPVPGIKRAPYDPTTPRTSAVRRQLTRAARAQIEAARRA